MNFCQNIWSRHIFDTLVVKMSKCGNILVLDVINHYLEYIVEV